MTTDFKISAVTPKDSVKLNLTGEMSIVLPVRDAFGLMLFATGVGWSRKGLTTFNCKLKYPQIFRSEVAAWPEQTINSVLVTGIGIADSDVVDAPFESLWFTTGPNVDQVTEVDRVEVLRALNDYFVKTYGQELYLEDSYSFPEKESEHRSVYTPTGAGDVLIKDGSTVGLYKKIKGDYYSIVDIELFMVNKSIARPPHVDRVTFISNVYTSGYDGEAKKAAIQFHFGKGVDLVTDC